MKTVFIALACALVAAAPASAQRKAVLDALRPAIETKLGPNVEFVIQVLRVEDGWAFVMADPQRKGGKPIDGNRYFGEDFDNMDGLRVDAVLQLEKRPLERRRFCDRRDRRLVLRRRTEKAEARLRLLRRQRFVQPGRDDRIAQIVDAAMLDRQAEIRINDAGARSGFARRHDDQPAVDLLPPVHPRGILLADEAALGEADAVQLGGIAFEPEEVAELGAALADAEAEAVLEPAGGRLVRPARASGGRARAGGGRSCPSSPLQRPMDREPVVALDADRAAQAVDRQALDQVVRRLGLAVEQQVVAVGPDDEVEQAFALRRQQAGPDRKLARRRRW